MHRRFIALAMTLAPALVLAEEPCALRVANLLSTGRTAELSEIFKRPGADTPHKLMGLAAKAGVLSEPTIANQPRSTGQIARFSVLSEGLPPAFGFMSYRVNALSSTLGQVQLHIAVEPDTACSVLAIYLEYDPQVRVSSASSSGRSPTNTALLMRRGAKHFV